MSRRDTNTTTNKQAIVSSMVVLDDDNNIKNKSGCKLWHHIKVMKGGC